MSKGSLRTPEAKVRKLQEGLHRSAKADKRRRFHQLYDKVSLPWVLEMAWRKVRSNKGVPGPDGISIEKVESDGVEKLLDELTRELRDKTYRAGPVLRTYIPKPNGKLRPLGIPNIRDRLVQTAVSIVLTPIYEADLPDSAYGYRLNRKAQDALEEVQTHLLRGYTDVVDADLEAFFDTIEHDKLMALLRERIVDGGILWLITQWLKAPVIEPTDPPGSCGKRNERGTPQGGSISPLLANIYHATIPRVWFQWKETRRLGGKFVSYADDFVILLRPGKGAKAREALGQVCERLSLKLNEGKTRVVQAEQESFGFLGFDVKKELNARSGKRYPRVTPSPGSEQRLRDRIREIANRKTEYRPPKEIVEEVNEVVRGWQGYFYFGNPQHAMKRLNRFLEERLRKWLVRKHARQSQGYVEFPQKQIYGELGLHRLPICRPGFIPRASG